MILLFLCLSCLLMAPPTKAYGHHDEVRIRSEKAQDAPVCGNLINPTDWHIDGEPVTIKATYKGSFPVINTAPWSYNTKIVDEIDDKLFMIDQKTGMIHMHRNTGDNTYSGEAIKVLDISEYPISGLSFDDFTYLGSNSIEKIQMISKGKKENEYYVVFSSKTLPENITHKYLPPPIMENVTLPTWFRINNCDLKEKPAALGYYDLLRLPCADVLWKVFVKMTLVNDKLVNAEPFYAHEIQHGSGHFGGGMVTTPLTGKILYGVGDCLPPGTNGLSPSQDINSHCGKILLIDPDQGTATVALKGIRNPQVMMIHRGKLMWADIGGVSAEEVNSICLNKVIDTSIIENFGWGMRDNEDFAREGTFKVNSGIPFGSGQPECLGYLTEAERKGFYDPVVQFSRRGPNIPFYGVASMVVSRKSFQNFEILATDFYSGEAIVAKSNHCVTSQRGYNVTVVNEHNEAMFDGFNGLNRDFLNISSAVHARGDSRFFLFSDRTAGVFIERTGQIYSLEEVTNKTLADKPNDIKCRCKEKCAKENRVSKACGASKYKLARNDCCDGLVCHEQPWIKKCVKEEHKNCAPPGGRSIECGLKWNKAILSCCPGLVCGAEKRCVVPPTSEKV